MGIRVGHEAFYKGLDTHRPHDNHIMCIVDLFRIAQLILPITIQSLKKDFTFLFRDTYYQSRLLLNLLVNHIFAINILPEGMPRVSG